MCCLAHDVCYAEHFSQEACDQAFCECLNAMAEEARGTQYAMGCLDASQWFCFAVKMFGHSAHGSAKKSVANESMAQNVTESVSKPAKPFTVGTTTSETAAMSSAPAPAREARRSFGVLVQNVSLNCGVEGMCVATVAIMARWNRECTVLTR